MNDSFRVRLLPFPVSEKGMCLAPKARHSSQAWGIAPGFMVPKPPSAESANHFPRH